MPVTTLISVVLPEPLGPIRARIWPGPSVRLTWSSARKPPKATDTFSKRSNSANARLPWNGLAQRRLPAIHPFEVVPSAAHAGAEPSDQPGNAVWHEQ